MLQIEVPENEFFNEKTNEFFKTKGVVLQLEHSLISISKWEAKWERPFLSDGPKTSKETIDYIRCMTLNHNVDPSVYECLTESNLSDINKYIEAPMTATWFNEKDKKLNRDVITSEIIYYWMITYNIPPEYRKWHLNTLLTLIRVCSIKNSSQKKMSRKEVMARNRELNAARRAKFRSKG